MKNYSKIILRTKVHFGAENCVSSKFPRLLNECLKHFFSNFCNFVTNITAFCDVGGGGTNLRFVSLRQKYEQIFFRADLQPQDFRFFCLRVTPIKSHFNQLKVSKSCSECLQSFFAFLYDRLDINC